MSIKIFSFNLEFNIHKNGIIPFNCYNYLRGLILTNLIPLETFEEFERDEIKAYCIKEIKFHPFDKKRIKKTMYSLNINNKISLTLNIIGSEYKESILKEIKTMVGKKLNIDYLNLELSLFNYEIKECKLLTKQFRYYTIDFKSPTLLKYNNSELIFPILKALFYSTMQLYNSFSENIIDNEYFNKEIERLSLFKYNLESRGHLIRDKIEKTGFKGNIRFSNNSKLPISELVSLMSLLNVGKHRTQGMGQCTYSYYET